MPSIYVAVGFFSLLVVLIPSFMSEIKRQSILSSLFMYAGIAVGFVNIILLFPVVLLTEQYGFTRWLLMIGSTLGLFAQLGIPSITYKFFPYFKDKTQKHHGYLSLALLLPLIGVGLACLFVFIFQDFIIDQYSKPESLDIIQQYYWLLIPLTLFVVYYNILNAYSTSLMRAAVPIFFRDVFVRLATTIILLLHYWQIIDFNAFVIAYTMIFGLQSVGLLIFLKSIGELQFKWDFSKFWSMSKEMIRYGGYALFSGGAAYIVSNIDGLMVSSLAADQLKDLGIYSVFFFIGTVIMVPAKAITSISLPVVAESWKNDNLARIDEVYKKTAITQLVVGFFLFILIWSNIDNFIALLASMGKPEYEAGKYVALFVGLAKLFDGATGINGGIIVTSKHYRFDLLFVIALIGLSILTNYLFIPQYGILGAAIATAFTAFIYNFGKFLFVKFKFGLQPFSKKTWLTILVGTLILGLNYVLPSLDNFIFDLIYRSVILGGLYLGLTFFLELSPEINKAIKQVLKRVGI